MLSLAQFEEATTVLGSFKCSLPAVTVATAVLTTAREIFNAAASVQSAEVQQAQQCLSLAPLELDDDVVVAEVATELRLVTAAQKLAAIGYTKLVPLQLRLRADHLTTLREIVSSGLTDQQEVLALSRVLGGIDECLVREILAMDAIAHANAEAAYEQCEWMMRHTPSRRAWSLCHGLASQPELSHHIPINFGIPLELPRNQPLGAVAWGCRQRCTIRCPRTRDG